MLCHPFATLLVATLNLLSRSNLGTFNAPPEITELLKEQIIRPIVAFSYSLTDTQNLAAAQYNYIVYKYIIIGITQNYLNMALQYNTYTQNTVIVR